MTEKRKPLTAQQEAFCQEYVKRLLAGELSPVLEAYRAAYKNQKGSDAVLAVNASRLLSKPHIKARMDQLRAAMDKEFAVESKQLLQEASRLAFADLRKLFNQDGTLKAPYDLDEDTAKAIASIKVHERFSGDERFVTYEYKFWDKNSALERLYKHKGLFEQDNKQKNSGLEEIYKLIQGGKPPIKQ